MLTPTFTNAATIAFHVRNAVIFDGSVYARNYRHFIADRKLFKQVAAQRYLTTAGLTSTTIGARYLGHWLRDDCIQYLLAKTTGAAVSLSTPASDHKARYSDHKARYASYFGQDWTSTDREIVDDLIIYQDCAQNSLKVKRYERLTSMIGARFAVPKTRDKLVYIRRGQTGVAGRIDNEARLLDVLIRTGFVILDIANDDLD